MLPMVKNVAAGILVLVIAFLVIEGIKKAKTKKSGNPGGSTVNPAASPGFAPSTTRDTVG